MKNYAKRGFSLLLVFAMCISLLSGLAATAGAAVVDYVRDGNYIYNWGERGAVATYLSPNAEAFYADNSTSYAALSQLSGASDVADVPYSGLYQKLKALMTNAQTTVTSYDDTRELFRYTDCEKNGTKISSFYSGNLIGPNWDSGKTWNREHTWPDSKGDASGSGENDIMMLRPTSKNENTSRGNTAYGESAGFYDPNTVSGGKYDLRGDVARIMLYVYTRWGNTESMWNASGVIESKAVLLKWVEEDPVDTWELGRNDAVESITGTRNVYVDYPELAFRLFNTQIPDNYSSPSGAGSVSSFEINVGSNNTAWGTVECTGTQITAFPMEGYYAADCLVLSGTAEVTRESANTFSVNPSTGCYIQVQFAPRENLTVTFSENGLITGQVMAYAGDSISLPSATVTADGVTFVGWTAAEVSETTQTPEFYTAGSSYEVNSQQTLYALYSRLDTTGIGTGIPTVYEPFSGPLTEGYYIFTAAGSDIGAMTAAVESGRLTSTTVTLAEDNIVDPADAIIWQVVVTDDGYYTFYNPGTARYAAGTGAKNKADIVASVSDYTKWSYTYSGQDYDFSNAGNKAAGVNYQLRRNAQYGFACYASSTGTQINLYRGVGGTVYYTTDASACQHQWTEWLEITAPTCEADGMEARECTVCKAVQTNAIFAAGHSYTDTVTPPTETEQGYTTHTCGNCGNSYTDSFVEPLGPTYTVTFVVPDGVTAVDSMGCNRVGIQLPEAGNPDGQHDYTFAGWTEAAVNDTSDLPQFYATGEVYTAAANTTLYALYTYTAGGSGSGKFIKVTETLSDWSGEYVLTDSSDTYVLLADGTAPGTTNAAKTLSAAGMTVAGTTLSGVSDSYILVVEKVGSNYSMKLKGAAGTAYLMTTNNNSGFNTVSSTDNTNAQWSLSMDGANAVIKNIQYATMTVRFNNSSKQFRTYTSGQNAVNLYRKDGSGTIRYYTTVQSSAAEPTTIESAGLVLNSVLGVRFYTRNTSGTVKIAVGSGEAVEIAASAESAKPGYREFKVDVFAQNMMNTITATLYSPSGQLLDAKEFKLTDYVTKLQATEGESQTTKELAAATLAYCQYAAIVKGNFTGQPSALPVIPEDAFADHSFVVGSTAKGISIHTYLEEACQLRLRLPADYQGCTATIDGQTVMLVQDGSTWLVSTPELLPQDYSQKHAFVISRDGEAVYSGQFSVLMYLGRCIGKNVGTEDMQNLLQAMYHYYAAADAYLKAV